MHLRSIMRATLIIGVALGAAGCDSEGKRPDELFLPPTGFVADPAQGRDLFLANCARCHGEDARGTDHGPPLIHRIYEPSHHSDFAFYRAIHRGSRQHHWGFGDMPPVEGVTAKQAGHIITYLRQKQRRAGIR